MGFGLLEAVSADNARAVQDLLNHGVSFTQRDQDSNTPLMLAASRGNLKVLQTLLQFDPDVNAQNALGHTALTKACASGKVDVVQLLLRTKGVALDACDKQGHTAMTWAAKTGNKELAQMLLSAGVPLDTPDALGRTPLLHACMTASAPVAALLLDAGADPKALDKSGHDAAFYCVSDDVRRLVLGGSPLADATAGATATTRGLSVGDSLKQRNSPSLAISASIPRSGVTPLVRGGTGGLGSTEVSLDLQRYASPVPQQQQQLLTLSSDVPPTSDQDGNTAMHVACIRGDEVGLQDLLRDLDRGNPVIDSANRDGLSPLGVAAMHGRARCSELLLAAGATVNLSKDVRHSTPLHLASRHGHTEVVNLLLETGASVGSIDTGGSTPVMEAAEYGHAAVLDALLGSSNGRAYANVARRDSCTPLLMAVRCKSREAVQALLRCGADPNQADAHGETPLMEASTAGALDLVSLLLAGGADCNVRNVTGETALMRSAVLADTGAVNRLLQAGAQVDANDAEMGFTPLMFASSQGRTQVVRTLLRAGAAVNHASSVTGVTALLLASRMGYSAVVDALLQGGANPNQCDSMGSTPLIVAAIGGFIPVVEALLRAGAQPGAHTYEGYTAMSAAAEFGQHAVVDMLSSASVSNASASTASIFRQASGSLVTAFGGGGGTASNGGGGGGGPGGEERLSGQQNTTSRRNSLRVKQPPGGAMGPAGGVGGGGAGSPRALSLIAARNSTGGGGGSPDSHNYMPLVHTGSLDLTFPPSVMPDGNAAYQTRGDVVNATRLSLASFNFQSMNLSGRNSMVDDNAPRLLMVAMPKAPPQTVADEGRGLDPPHLSPHNSHTDNAEDAVSMLSSHEAHLDAALALKRPVAAPPGAAGGGLVGVVKGGGGGAGAPAAAAAAAGRGAGPLKQMRSILVRDSGGVVGEDGVMVVKASPASPATVASVQRAVVVGSKDALDEMAIYPGKIVRSPFSKILRFRDPTEADTLLYEIDEAEWADEEDDYSDEEEEVARGCFERRGCSIS